MTRTVADAALKLNLMAEQHVDDPASVLGELDLPLDQEEIEGWRIALSMDLGYFEVDPEVAGNTESAAKALREALPVLPDFQAQTAPLLHLPPPQEKSSIVDPTSPGRKP